MINAYDEASRWRDTALCWYPFEKGARILEACEGVESPGGGFDYIIALDPKDFSVAALKALRDRLNSHGRLLLAYENPYRLRYWAGKPCAETGLPYDTLRGLSGKPSKAELSERLAQAGFEGQRWYYPMEDHWFPSEVYSDDYLPDAFFNHRMIPSLNDDILQLNEASLYSQVVRNGAFRFMCGAFLTEARVCACDSPCPVDYAAITAYREPSKRFVTVVRNDGEVHKTPLHADGRESVRRILRNHEKLVSFGVNVVPARLAGDTLVMPRLNQPTLWRYWEKKISKGVLDSEEIISQYDRLREAIYAASAEGTCFWEMVPANCFIDEQTGTLTFFDQEYTWENTSPDVAVARALLPLMPGSGMDRDGPAALWLSALTERYGLTGQWDELIKIVCVKTNEEVFGGEEALFSKLPDSVAFARRVALFRVVPGKLRIMGYKRPVIYGHGRRGKALERALKDAGTTIAAIVDKQSQEYAVIEAVPTAAGADAVIVSVLNGAEIAEDLRKKTALPIYMLEELLDG